jgi:UDP:flavonoid glycosyltransferase YjiC (YdhE family)
MDGCNSRAGSGEYRSKSGSKKPRVLFIGEAVTLAHVTRPLVLADSLNRDQYHIVFACGSYYQNLIGKAGYDFREISTISPELFYERLANGKPLYTTKELENYVASELELFSRVLPDFVVGDFRISLGISTEIAGIPYAALANAHWSPYSNLPVPLPEHPAVRFFGVKLSRLLFPLLQPVIFRFHSRGFNRLRKAHSLSVLKGLQEVYTYGAWTLYADIPSCAPTENLPKNHLYIGPIIWSPSVPFPGWWDCLPADSPVIYVTLGSSGNISVIHEVIDSLKELHVSTMIATADRVRLAGLPANMFTANYLPGIEAAKRAEMVICSGGSATVYQALSVGVPVLGLPSNTDQYFTMEGVSRKGAGILIRSGKADRQLIGDAVKRIFNDVSFKKAAIELEREIGKFNAQERFAGFLRGAFNRRNGGVS